VLDALAKKNQEYLDRFGFIFIVCAAGKSGEEILAALEQRLPLDRAVELGNAAEEQRQIARLRLEKLLR
jgi:2-oxo-4-hydroxy-4-carboxy-5-ureidoimidazoline decarboxylase